jgi:transketolase
VRSTFVKTLIQIAAQDERVLLLTGDLGFMALEPFIEAFPDRFFNVGVAEQNMVGMATGLAEAGFVPFTYSIVTFATLRPYEFIRNGPVFHRLPVRIVGMGGGFEYGAAGPTHHGLEDVAVMRTLPGMTVLCPADAEQARAALLATWDLPGPVYYRLGKDDKTLVPGLSGRFALDRVEILREGKDLILIAMGPAAIEALAAAGRLEESRLSACVAVVPTLAPAPAEDLARILRSFSFAIAIEAHSVVGGLGSLVCEVVAENGFGCRVVRLGVRQTPNGTCGSQSFLHNAHGISAEGIVAAAVRATGEALA